jgi:hypothetical protein
MKPQIARRAMTILWPAFLMAGVLEALVFVVVDPGELHWFGGPALDWPVQTVYSVTFLIFWAVIGTAGAMTALLSVQSDELNSFRRENR